MLLSNQRRPQAGAAPSPPSLPSPHQAAILGSTTCVDRTSATLNMSLRMPSRREMTALSEMKMERPRCAGREMRAKMMPIVIASMIIPTSDWITITQLAAQHFCGPVLPNPAGVAVPSQTLQTARAGCPAKQPSAVPRSFLASGCWRAPMVICVTKLRVQHST